jgi:hypothetical protein
MKVRVDPASHRLKVEAWVGHPPSASFYLHRGFGITLVEADGVAADFHRDAGADPIAFSPSGTRVAVDAAQIQELHVAYTGAIQEPVAKVNMITPDLVELALYCAWLPLFEGLPEATFELEADLPVGYVVVANGTRTDQCEEDGRARTRWVSQTPAVDIVLVASPRFRRAESSASGAHIEVYYQQLPAEMIERRIADLREGREWLEAIYGPPSIPPAICIVYAPRCGWGYVRPGLVVVSEGEAQDALGDPYEAAMEFRYSLHEIAHLWWSIADPSTPDDWINEGLAEYSAFRFCRQRYSAEITDRRVEGYRQAASQSGSAIAETETGSPDREANQYNRVPLMFVEAESRFGAEPLSQFLRSFYRRFAGTRAATTGAFLAEARRHLGTDSETFFREALYCKPGADCSAAQAE